MSIESTPCRRRRARLAVACFGAACALAWLPAAAAENIPSAAPGRVQDPAPGWDRLWHTVIVDISIIGIVFALAMAYFLVRYRKRAAGEVGSAPVLSSASMVGWAVIPLFVFLADDLYLAANGWMLWNDYRDVPAERMEVRLESGMYSWDYTYANGVKTQNELRVPVGKPVLLRMTSRDTIHSHFIPDFRVKEDSMPGRMTYLWFVAPAPGAHVVTCAEYCGVMHSYMAGRIVAMPEAEFKTWLDGEAAKLAPAAANPA